MACGLPSPWGPSLPSPYEDRGGGFKLFVIEGFHFSLPFFPARRLGRGFASCLPFSTPFFLRESGRGFIGGEGSKNSALLQDFAPGKSFAFENIN